MNTERPCRGEHLKGKVPELAHPVALSDAGKLAAGLAIATAILLASSSTGIPLGLPTCLAAVAAILLVTMKDRQAPIPVAQEVSWSMIPLVADVFENWCSGHAPRLGHSSGRLNIVFVSTLARSLYAVVSYGFKTA
jgi:hypothetical protein